MNEVDKQVAYSRAGRDPYGRTATEAEADERAYVARISEQSHPIDKEPSA